jgi:hypothetical protein
MNPDNGSEKKDIEKRKTTRRKKEKNYQENSKTQIPSKKKVSKNRKVTPPVAPVIPDKIISKKLKKVPKLLTSSDIKDSPEILSFITRLIKNAGNE